MLLVINNQMVFAVHVNSQAEEIAELYSGMEIVAWTGACPQPGAPDPREGVIAAAGELTL